MSKASLPKASLLCIDDDQAVLECEKAFLESFGYTVMTASSGPEGLKLAGRHSFDVLIVDYNMPTMSGQEFAVAMRQLRPLAPIIMLSGVMDLPEQALKVVDAFVPKSCLASRLLTAIELLCGSESRHRIRMTNDRGKPVHNNPDECGHWEATWHQPKN